MSELLVVGLGGFLGAIARYGLSGLVHRWYDGAFPLGTLVVNLLGCFVLGGFMTLVEERQLFAAHTRLFVTIGCLGAFTTFSTLGYETLELMRDRAWGLAAANALGSVAAGLLAVWLGRILVLAVWR